VLRAEAVRAMLVENPMGAMGETHGGSNVFVTRHAADAAVSASTELVYGNRNGEGAIGGGLGTRWVQALEEKGWWVGRPLLEEDVEHRLELLVG